MSSTTSRADREDHPYVFAVVNSLLWLTLFLFVALPFGMVSATVLLLVRLVSLADRDGQLVQLVFFLELGQLMPEICIDYLWSGVDFLQTIDRRYFATMGTPV